MDDGATVHVAAPRKALEGKESKPADPLERIASKPT
jgi:hypothetical protein